jgi:hypothetical protein
MLVAVAVFLLCLIAAGLVLLSSSVRVLREYERGVVCPGSSC